ncbi:MAG: hypothetical protein IJU23_07345 [Proteobacteria bacterium]|nr:hypothetical protein [Pseudomonadota bacterium]
MFRKVSVISALIAGLCIFGGCVIDGSESGANATVEAQTDVYLDYDNNKDGALGLIFGMTAINDRLDFTSGDSEDWRYIVVAEPGNVTIKFRVDKPGSVTGGWKVIDADNRTLKEEMLKGNQEYYEYQFSALRGVYYFQAYTTGGGSIYTLGAEYQRTQPQAVAVNTYVEEEEDEVEPEPVKPVKTETKNEPKKNKTTTKKSDSDDTKPATTKNTKKEEPPAPTGHRVVGKITGLTPNSDGSYKVTINVGKDKGVDTGTKGTIEGASIKIETSQCFATRCFAIVPEKYNPKSLKAGANVAFTVN